MRPITLGDIVDACGPEIRGTLSATTEFRWIERNSRDVQPGDLFIAVRGEQHDGHRFVPDAATHGASAALVSRTWAAGGTAAGELPLLIVDDPVVALQQVARARRRSMPLRVIGVTGSIGKTSTKEVIAAVAGQRFVTYRSPGNMNSEIGLPLSLLEIEPGTEVAVLEMGGAYAFGELALLAEIAQPQIGVVTNVHPVHLERMGSIEAIAQTKSELVASLGDDGVAILNGDDPRVRAMAVMARGRSVTYGLQGDNDIWADQVETLGLRGSSFRLHLNGESLHIRVPLVGGHAVELALAAIAVGDALGMHISEMLPGFDDPVIQVRLLVIPGPNGSQIIDDTYNASAPSVLSALDLLDETSPPRKIAVLGDMRELGEESEAQHRLVGQRVARTVDHLVTYGELAQIIAEEATAASSETGNRVKHVTSFSIDQRAELVDFLLEELQPRDIVLIKGSRGLRMEEFVEALQDAASQGASEAGRQS